jgi:hypothetical protein
VLQTKFTLLTKKVQVRGVSHQNFHGNTETPATLAILGRFRAAAASLPAPISRRCWYSPVRPADQHVDSEVDGGLPVVRKGKEDGGGEGEKGEEAEMAEGRKQALLRRKLLILQISLASTWAVAQIAKGWRPQLSGQGLEEQVAAALAMIKLKDPEDLKRLMAKQEPEDLENWTS